MLAWLKRRSVLIAIGFVLFALFIWIAGPLIAFAGYVPLLSVLVRVLVIAVVIGGWVIWRVLQIHRANQKSAQLMTEIAQQRESAATRSTADVQSLRNSFQEAIDRLGKRRGGQSLYEVPWYVIIGAPGAGKSTILKNSGLHFPSDQRATRDPIQGVAGTRNCQWWFGDEAILLDTAGRYTSQDSDEKTDRAEWTEFLALLKKYRRRRPVNGVLLTISAFDLMTEGKAGLERQMTAARQRLDELHRDLGIRLPVYVIVTKCDLVAGFAQYYDDLDTREKRSQVWGVTFPYERTLDGSAAQTFPSEFDALIARLNERVYMRLDAERDGTERGKVFAFPQQMAAIGEPLVEFVSDIFSTTRFENRVLLRGVYFTSGTQYGTPIDYLIGLSFHSTSPGKNRATLPGSDGKAYFVERLMRDVLIGESGLAGVNRNTELRLAAAKVAGYLAIGAAAVLLMVAMFWSYRSNRAYIDSVAADAQRLPLLQPISGNSPASDLVARLNVVRDVVDSVDRFQQSGVPWRLRWGLFQGPGLIDTAWNRYVSEMSLTLLPRVVQRLEEHLNEPGVPPEEVYDYLKARLMFAERGRLVPEHVTGIAANDWDAEFAAQPDVAQQLTGHFLAMLEHPAAIPLYRPDDSALRRWRNTVTGAKLYSLVYRRLKLKYTGQQDAGIRLDEQAGNGVEKVLYRRSGTPLTKPLSGFFTPAVFQTAANEELKALSDEILGEKWVWDGARDEQSGTLKRDVTAKYEGEYGDTWDAVLNDIAIRPASGLTDLATLLMGVGPPLRGALQAVSDNTMLLESAASGNPGGAQAAVKGAAASRANGLLKRAGIPLTGRASATASAPPPGATVTKRFEALHKLFEGEPGKAPIDGTLELMAQVGQKLRAMDPSRIGGSAADPGQVNALLQQLDQEIANLPPAVASIVASVRAGSADAVRQGVRSDLMDRYRQDVQAKCVDVVNRRYPFFPASNDDAPVGDVVTLFSSGGIFDMFFQTSLLPLLKSPSPPYQWKNDESGKVVVGSTTMLRQFERVSRLREMLTPTRGQGPAKFMITTTPVSGANRTVLQIDGQTFEGTRALSNAKQGNWPGPNPGLASITFDDRPTPAKESRGEWAFFRLLDSATVKRESATRHLATFKFGTVETTVLIQPLSIWNPFEARELRELQQFRCEI